MIYLPSTFVLVQLTLLVIVLVQLRCKGTVITQQEIFSPGLEWNGRVW